jgi:hypothetical protein
MIIIPGFQWFNFQMAGFKAIKWFKQDRKSNGHLIFGPVFKWLQQDGGHKWSRIGMYSSR